MFYQSGNERLFLREPEQNVSEKLTAIISLLRI